MTDRLTPPAPAPGDPPGDGHSARRTLAAAFGRRHPDTVHIGPSGVNRLRAVLWGDVDMDNARTLGRAMAAALDDSSEGLDVDLAAVDFCGSSGLHVLLALRERAAATGKSLVLTAVSPAVARLLEVTETDALFARRPLPDDGDDSAEELPA
ncbi:STAS domain-containing protein [Kitasatospora sp. NPDC085895]|uniref:STAS domain-containing protein n=1 Tax=Kitasatospora sp. NPDC085895 TaxID=3155057 RepID=UPI00344D1332